MTAPAWQDELFELASALCEGTASAEQVARLEAIVLADDEACRTYLDYLALHGSLCLRSANGTQAKPQIRNPKSEANLKSEISIPQSPPPTPQPRTASPVLGFLDYTRTALSKPILWSILGAGLAFGIYATVITWGIRDRAPHAANSELRIQNSELGAVATITDSSDARGLAHFPKSSKENVPVPFTPGEAITPGEPLHLTSGLAELKLKQGATLLVEGPAQWSIDGDNRATLKQGKLVAKVPQQAIGFTLDTPSAKIIDLGTEFGVAASESGITEVHVLRGVVETLPLPSGGYKGPEPKGRRLNAGEAISIGVNGTAGAAIAFDAKRFRSTKLSTKATFAQTDPFTGTIPLGNLFDDRPPISLADAVATDTYLAVPDSGHLGIESVFIGGGPVRKLTRNLTFDLALLGWNGQFWRLPTNDGIADDLKYAAHLPIHTKGQPSSLKQEKDEDGIGLHACGQITFDLDQIRSAGNLVGVPMRFVSDRTGVCDSVFGNPGVAINMLAMIADETKFLDAVVNGNPAAVTERDGVWRLERQPEQPLISDGRFVRFELFIPPHARFLTLATGSPQGPETPHGVWSGARLEVVVTAEDLNRQH